MEKFVNLISSHRWWFITFIAIITGFFGYNASSVKTDNSIEIWLKQDDPALTFYNKFKEDFGNEEFLLITIDDEDIFNTENIRLISRISLELMKLKGISDVTSLSTIFKQKLNTPYFKELLTTNKKADSKTNTLDVLRQELLTDPLYVNNVISKDGKTTAIIAMVEGPVANDKEGKEFYAEQNWSEFRKELVNNVRKIIESVDSDIYLAGPTVINAELDRMSQQDLAMFVPLMFCIAFIVLIILFRKVSGVILPMAAIGISNVWTIGLYAVCGNSMNMISGIMTPVIFIITLATSIHIINHYYFETSGSSNRQSIIDTMKVMGIPCFFTCLTTAIGFLSLMTSDVSPVKVTGGFTSAGIMISFFISTVLITITFLFFGSKRSNHKRSVNPEPAPLEPATQLFHNLLGRISSFVCHKTRFILIFFVVLIAVSVCGILRLKIESDIIKAFPEDSEIIIANDHIEDNLTGLLPLEIVVSSSNNETIINPKTLNSIGEFQDFLMSINEVTFTLSAVDVIKRVNQTINKGDIQYYKIPESAKDAGICLNMASLYGGSIVDNLFNQDKTSARISVRMKQVGSDQYGKILDRIKDYIKNNIPENISMKITGVVHLLIKMQDYLLVSQIKTFSLAFATIFIVMIFLLRSIKFALISMIPNIIPVVFTIGAMGYMGIRLDAGTMMIASVAIGIAVDDTIHFLYRFKKEFNQRVISHADPMSNLNPNVDIREHYIISIDQTLQHVGRAIIFTSIIAFCGFLALCLSQFKPIQYFGLLTAITMVNALIADLFVLPSCLLFFQPKKF
ncbi:MAG: efflux RND transporter permease subunit [Candidatus Anammoxibacter sp.]